MKVCVLGLWHLGCVTAAGVSSRGHSVVGLDFDDEVVGELARGRPPISEPGLAEAIAAGIDAGSLRFSTDPAVAAEVDALWIAYDTPVDEDDVADTEYVFTRFRHVLPSLRADAVVMVSSQLPVGSIRRLEEIVAREKPGSAFDFASIPENLRLGGALKVFLEPDRLIVGVRTLAARARLEALLGTITPRIEWMSVESAEMTKHAINSFLATSVAFANEIASICESVGADAKEVERGLKTESRIGPKAYLSPGAAFAGGTLARDIAYLTTIASGVELKTPLLGSVKVSNDEHKGWARRVLLREVPDLEGAVIAVWGLTYKPGTDTLRRSGSVELCDWLLTQGATVRVHDPVVKNLPPHWSGKVVRVASALEALAGAAALVVGTEWPEYRELPADALASAAATVPIIDANRFLSRIAVPAGLRIIAVGSPAATGRTP
ncbi:UDP-glucose/GDP-mannose dehydrogenase family protein [soil metagenome]